LKHSNLLELNTNTNATYKEIAYNLFVPVAKLGGNSKILREFIKNKNVRIIETKYGKCEQRNRLLTELHQRVLTAIIHNGRIVREGDDTIAYYKQSDILKALGMSKHNHTHLRNTIKEISDAQMYFTIGSISSNMRIITKHIYNDDGQHGIIFDPNYVKIKEYDFSVSYKELLPKLFSIPYPTIPTIIRYLTFKSISPSAEVFELDKVLFEIGFPIESESSYKTVKSNLKKYRDVLLQDFNIEYDYKKKTFICNIADRIEYLSGFDAKFNVLEKYIGRKITVSGNKGVIESIDSVNATESQWRVVTADETHIYNVFLDDLINILDKTKE